MLRTLAILAGLSQPVRRRSVVALSSMLLRPASTCVLTLALLAACGGRPNAVSEAHAAISRANAECREQVMRIDFDAAHDLCLDALQRSSELGDDALVYAEAIANAALLFHMRGRYDDAEAFYERALELHAEHDDTEADIALARTLADRAHLDIERHRPRQALPRQERALSLLRNAGAAAPPELLAGVMADIGETYEALGELDTAVQWHAESLAAFREHFGDEHANVGVALNNLATLYQRQERFDDAEKLLRDALLRLREQLGDEHPMTQTAERNLRDNVRLREDAGLRSTPTDG